MEAFSCVFVMCICVYKYASHKQAQRGKRRAPEVLLHHSGTMLQTVTNSLWVTCQISCISNIWIYLYAVKPLRGFTKIPWSILLPVSFFKNWISATHWSRQCMKALYFLLEVHSYKSSCWCYEQKNGRIVWYISVIEMIKKIFLLIKVSWHTQ